MAEENKPTQPEEEHEFDDLLGSNPKLDESEADFDAEEQNPKEATA